MCLVGVGLMFCLENVCLWELSGVESVLIWLGGCCLVNFWKNGYGVFIMVVGDSVLRGDWKEMVLGVWLVLVGLGWWGWRVGRVMKEC